MSDENNEERIATLEKIVAELQSNLIPLLNMIGDQTSLLIRFGEAVTQQREALNSVLRFIGSNPVFGDSADRQNLLNLVSSSESKADQLLARFAALNKPQNPPAPPPPPA